MSLLRKIPKKIIFAFSFFIIAVVAILVVFPKTSTPTTLTMGTNNYVSLNDETNQQIILNLTTFNWSNIPTKPDGTEKQILAALLLLYNEETSVFYPEAQSINITTVEADQLGIKSLPNEPNSKNLSTLIDYLIAVEKQYSTLGLVPAKTHIKRLTILKDYFAKHSVNPDYQIPEKAKEISESVLVASNHKDYAERILIRFNNWLASR